MAWDPGQYARFADARLRPAMDLLARIDLSAPESIVDLGCGSGNVTRLLRARWPQARITGVDSSASMLAEAQRQAPDVHWVQADLRDWRATDAPSLIYSNAALHWIDAHAERLPALLRQLAPGGVLAVQMPNNFSAPSHTAIAATALDGPWREALAPLLGPAPVAPAEHYLDWLLPDAAALDVWQTEYLQLLEGLDPVKEWTKGTWLRPFLARLDAPRASAFEAAYAARLREAYPPRADGRTVFPFRRLFIVARRAAGRSSGA